MAVARANRPFLEMTEWVTPQLKVAWGVSKIPKRVLFNTGGIICVRAHRV